MALTTLAHTRNNKAYRLNAHLLDTSQFSIIIIIL